MPIVKRFSRNSLLFSRKRKLDQRAIIHFDDDASVSSTITVDQQPEKKVAAVTKKSVRFNEAANQEHDNAVLCKEDTAALWYTGEDYQTMKTLNTETAKAIIKAEKQSNKDVNSNNPHSYVKVLQRAFDACLGEEDDDDEMTSTVLLADEQKYLQKWLASSVNASRIGLERKAVRTIAKDRYYRHKDVCAAVCRIQDENSNNVELMAEVSRRLSLPSRLFAREIAMAQTSLF